MHYASGHYTDRSGVVARGAATVASGVNPPEQRPSVSAATAHRRSWSAQAGASGPRFAPIPRKKKTVSKLGLFGTAMRSSPASVGRAILS
jgi:hypothetical protein